MNLDVDAPDKVASVLTAAATAYQSSAVELSATWQDMKALGVLIVMSPLFYCAGVLLASMGLRF
jgi:hypothetical protein